MATTDELLDKLAEALRSAATPLQLLRDADLGETETGLRLGAMLDRLGQASTGGLRVVEQGADRAACEPAGFTLVGTRGQRIRYLAVPEGPETQPFAEVLLQLAGLSPLPEALVGTLETLVEPADLMVFIAPGCPHCPHAVRSALTLAAASPLVTVQVIDAAAQEQLSKCFGVRSVPLTLIDGELAVTGAEPPQQLAERLLRRGSNEHVRHTLASYLESGRFGPAAERLCCDHRFRNAYTSLWRDSTLETRLALMLAAETVLETAPRALDDLVDGLLPALASPVIALRGDTADLLGMIGNPVAAEALTALQHDADPDVAEAASEALARLEV